MKDLTKGYPAKVIFWFAVPLTFGAVFQQLYNICDSKIVSAYVGTTAFAAVGATGSISNLVIGFINGLTQGFAIPVANSFGAKDQKLMRKYIAGMVILAGTVTVFLTVLSLMFISPLLRILHTPEEIFSLALSYVRIILAGILFTALYNLCANILRAVGDGRTPLICLVSAVMLNIILDLVFVRGLKLGIEGAAYATIIAQAAAGGLSLGFILKKFRELIPGKGEWKLDGAQYSFLLSSGIAMGLMSCIVNVGTVILQGAINSLGTVVVTAHTCARRIFDVMTVSISNVGFAMTTFAGQNIGAGRYERIRTGVRHAIFIVSGITTCLVVLCFCFGRSIVIWLTGTSDAGIVDQAVMYLRINVSFFYVLGPLFVLRCSLQGMGRRIIPVCSSVLELVIKVVSANLLVPAAGYIGVAFTEPISWCSMTVLLAAGYISSYRKLRPQGE